MKDDKRELRKLKKEIKRAGNKNRRNFLKRKLKENPDEAHWDEFVFKKNSSKALNNKPKSTEKKYANEGIPDGINRIPNDERNESKG